MSLLRYVQTLLFVLFAAAALQFFETFPNGWDQTEYCWAIQSGYLPHSPYIVYHLVGTLFSIPMSEPVALSAVSFLSGLTVLWLLTGVTSFLLAPSGKPRSRDRWLATLGVMVACGTFVFLRHTATQEVYMFQCALLIGSARCVVSGAGTRGLFLGAVLAGLAMGTHNGSLFALPALGYLALSRATIPARHATAVWLGSLSATVLAAVAIIWILLPAGSGLATYLRGIAPSVSSDSLGNPAFLFRSLTATFGRLTHHDIPIDRMPLAAGPLGVSILHLGLGIAGTIIAFVRNRRLGLFCALFTLPYFAYEVALGKNVDWGVYVVFLVPALAICAAVVFDRILSEATRSTWQGRAYIGILAGILLIAIIPNFVLVRSHWDDVQYDELDHFSDTVIASLWVGEHASENTVVLQPASEWNINALPFYSRRQHVMRRRNRFMVFDGFGTPHTALNFRAFSPLSGRGLADWILAGREVLAFEPAPLDGTDARLIDPRGFVWDPAQEVSLEAVAERHHLSEAVRNRVAGHRLRLYRARIRGVPQSR